MLSTAFGGKERAKRWDGSGIVRWRAGSGNAAVGCSVFRSAPGVEALGQPGQTSGRCEIQVENTVVIVRDSAR